MNMIEGFKASLAICYRLVRIKSDVFEYGQERKIKG